MGHLYFIIFPSLSGSHKYAVSPPNVPEPVQSEDPPVQPKSVDKSEAMFSMYLERSDEEDRKTTERWKRECDAILIFVSHSYQVCLRMSYRCYHRVDFFQPLSLPLLGFQFRTFGQIHKTPQSSILQASTTCSPILLAHCPRSSLRREIQLDFLHRNTRS